MVEFFWQLTVIILISVIIGIILKKLKQPVLLAYILTGIILGASFLNIIPYQEDKMSLFSELGIAFLLFLVGINLDIRVLRDLGKPSLLVGFGQVIFTTAIGILISLLLGFTILESIYLGFALAFSSTIIAVKLLTDKNEINSLYAKITVGALLVQDLIAIIILIFLSTYTINTSILDQLIRFLFNLFFFAIFVYFISKYIVEKLFSQVAKSQELLFLGAIGWCLLLASLATKLGFSKEIGAFIAGVSIASLPYNYEVFAKLKYLRDFFIVLFFVALGATITVNITEDMVMPSIILSLFVLIGNPIIVFLLMIRLGYTAKTSFLSGLCLAQISEFSFILVALGQKLGHINSTTTSITMIVGVITITISTYLIIYSKKVYSIFEKYLIKFQQTKIFEDSLVSLNRNTYDIIFIGFGRTGKSIISHFCKKDRKNILIVDFDPRTVKNAVKEGYSCIYGDAADSEIINFLIKHKPKIVVSTIADFETNRMIIKKIKNSDLKAKTIMLAENKKDAENLKKEGVDFVLIPQKITGKTISIIIDDILHNRYLELDWLKKESEEEMENNKIQC